MNTGIGDVLNGRKHLHSACDPRPLRSDSRASQLTRDVEGSSGPLLGMRKLESKRMRMSVNMGTKEARLSMVVTPLGRSSDRPKHLPMRQPSGGAPVVVGDVNDDHMAKGCRIICAGEPRCSQNLEGSRWAPENFSGGSYERRIVWKAGCLETCMSGLGLGPG